MSRWRAVVGQWRGLARTGLAQIGLGGGHFEMRSLLFVGWRAARLSRSCHKRCETRWDGGRYVETICAGRREGRDELGRVTMVSR